MKITPQDYFKVLIETSDCNQIKVRTWVLCENSLTGELKLEEL